MSQRRHVKPAPNPSTRILAIIGAIFYVTLMLPIFILILQAMVSGEVVSIPSSQIVTDAIWLSLRTSTTSLLIIIILGSPLAYIFARWQFRGSQTLQVLIQLPIVMPPVVAGLALLLTFGRRGFVGAHLAELGINITFTSWAVVFAQVFVAAPFFIRAAQVGFASVSQELEDAARVDGATEIDVFYYVTLPLALRAITSGAFLSWARAMGEFGATILFAGSLQGRTQTMSLLVYNIFEQDIEAAIWVGIILIAIAFVALLISQLLLPQDID